MLGFVLFIVAVVLCTAMLSAICSDCIEDESDFDDCDCENCERIERFRRSDAVYTKNCDHAFVEQTRLRFAESLLTGQGQPNHPGGASRDGA